MSLSARPSTHSSLHQASHIIALLSLTLCALTLMSACDDEGSVTEPCEVPAGECFRLGWTVEGAEVSATVLEASPSEPIKGLNTWTLSLKSPSGEAITGCQLHLAPYMPDHGHGSNEVDSEELEGGQYRLEGFDLIMPGYWELNLTLSCPQLSDAQSLTYGLWLEG